MACAPYIGTPVLRDPIYKDACIPIKGRIYRDAKIQVSKVSDNFPRCPRAKVVLIAAFPYNNVTRPSSIFLYGTYGIHELHELVRC